MAEKLKAAELFLSLGLVATLATGCGAPEEGGEAVEGDADVEAVEGAETEDYEPEGEEGGEGGEGGEG